MEDILQIRYAGKQDAMSKLMEENEVFCFDCDGVLWQGPNAVKGASEAISKLKENGKDVIFITNNSTKPRVEYADKLRSFGFDADVKDVFCTAFTSAAFLKDFIKDDEYVYVVGNEAMGKELDKQGIKHFGIGPDTEITSQQCLFNIAEPLKPKVRAVLVGMDGHFHYSKLAKAASYINKPNCIFVATNEDSQLPLGDSEYIVPGTGAIVKSVAVACGREPDYVCGKPHEFLNEFIKKHTTSGNKSKVMVGDRLDTDIVFGNKFGFTTLAVLTGVTDHALLRKVAEKAKSIDCSEDERFLVPNYYAPSIGDIKNFL